MTKTYDIDHLSLQSIREWFLAHVKSYSTSNELCQQQILFKRNHSLRVSALAGLISKRLYLSDEEITLAKTIGILHDIGRFEQFTRYETYEDHLSLDHGIYGSDLLSNNKLISNLSSSTQETILNAIAYHNKFRLPSIQDDKCLLHSKLVRDADKLDNIYITWKNLRITNYHHIINDVEPLTEISKNVLDSLMKGEAINYEELENEIDHIVHKISWVYDFNFIPTFQIFIERDFLSRFKEILPNSDTIHEIFTQLESYINERTA